MTCSLSGGEPALSPTPAETLYAHAHWLDFEAFSLTGAGLRPQTPTDPDCGVAWVEMTGLGDRLTRFVISWERTSL